jgi:mannose-1-phosphate guanylyltransferase
MNLYAIIMAGGVGSRFWPRSKKKTPKQLLKIFGNNTMIQETVFRILPIIKKENIFIVTNDDQKEGVQEQLPDIPKENILIEPFGRNTAACIGLASVIINSRDKDAITAVLPADHIIREDKEYRKTLLTAAEFAQNSKGLVTIGIIPSRPETGYGYIQIDEQKTSEGVFKVLTFAEKPNYSTAVRFIESGDFYWNSGMFIWRTDTILKEIETLMPDLNQGLSHIQKELGSDDFEENLGNIYGQLKKISIDYGVMEKSQNVFLVKGNFTWSDVGSWEEVYHLSEKDVDGNVKLGNVYTDLAMDSYIYSPDRITALIGIDNVIVINHKDTLLICKRDKSQDVKKIIDFLKFNKMDEYR